MNAMQQRAAAAAANGAPLVRRRLGDILYDSFFQYVQNFTYTVGTEALTAVVPIQSDAHFLCVETVYDLGTATGVVPAALSGGALIILTDGGSQRQLSSAQVPVSALFGTAQRPFVWPFTHLFRANSSIGIVATGSSAALMAGITMRLVFCGFKVPKGSVPELDL
jgi:hypothetical protein